MFVPIFLLSGEQEFIILSVSKYLIRTENQRLKKIWLINWTTNNKNDLKILMFPHNYVTRDKRENSQSPMILITKLTIAHQHLWVTLQRIQYKSSHYSSQIIKAQRQWVTCQLISDTDPWSPLFQSEEPQYCIMLTLS